MSCAVLRVRMRTCLKVQGTLNSSVSDGEAPWLLWKPVLQTGVHKDEEKFLLALSLSPLGQHQPLCPGVLKIVRQKQQKD